MCKCKDCGREFIFGTEGDNEDFCLKCCYLDLTSRDDYDADDDHSMDF